MEGEPIAVAEKLGVREGFRSGREVRIENAFDGGRSELERRVAEQAVPAEAEMGGERCAVRRERR